MKEKKKQNYILIGILFCLMGVLIFLFVKNKWMNQNKNLDTNTIDMKINTDDDDEKIDWTRYENISYELTKSITITKEGIYNLTGTISDGLITINTSGNVKLVLNNVNIANSNGPAILVKNASDVVIELMEGSTNTLEDGSNYSGFEEEEIGVIFSHDDITFDGEGTLVIKANKEDGIVSKDDLKIKNGRYEITSVDDGIRGKDSVYIQNGEFKITAGGDAIKSTNATDTEKGFVSIENGNFILNATLDGVQAETKLYIQNGDFVITTGGGSGIMSTSSTWGIWGTKTSSNNESAKGLKASDNLVIENGTFTINSSDDAIHSNNYIGIKNGTLNIESGDDGIHADAELIIDGGNITIAKSYEGLEASKITINDGNIKITSSDDGINVAGGNDASSMNRPGANPFSKNSNTILTINGGNIYVDADGDGLDANGSIYINGGFIKVDGPSNSGNGALDYDNECVVSGGVLLAGGASGMSEGVSNSSTIYSLFINFSSTYKSGDKITIVDGSNKEIISYESNKSYSSLVVASSELKKGNTYTIRVNGSDYQTITISNIVTSVGNSLGGIGNRPNGGGRGPK